MRKAVVGFLVGVVISGCSTSGPKARVLYHRPKANSAATKIVLMPVSDFAGEKTEGAESLEKSIAEGWAKVFDADRTAPAGGAIEEINQAMGLSHERILATMKSPAKAPLLKKDPRVTDYVKKIDDAVNPSHLAFAVVEGDKAMFEGGAPLKLWLGVFDTRTFAWKWVTKTIQKRRMFSSWEGASAALVGVGFDKASEVNISKISLTRKPASK